MSIVWESELDNQYDCKVIRIDEYNGTLTVVNKAEGNVLLCEAVTLSFGAPFGPDTLDVLNWQDRCVQAVDAQLG